MSEERKHYADLYHDSDGVIGVIPTCQCGWEIPKVSTYDEAAEAYAHHRLAAAFAALPVDEIRKQARAAASEGRRQSTNPAAVEEAADAASDAWVVALARELGEPTP